MKKMQCVILSLLLVLLLGSLPARAAEPAAERDAQVLCELGLLRGSDNGLELDRTPTRGEVLVMLLRLIGEEDEALAGNWEHPFTDAGWADAYIGYAYEKGLANGMSPTEFGTQRSATAQQYATFLLRALGYGGEDFTYAGAIDFLRARIPVVTVNEESFTRGDMAVLSAAALAAPMKDGSATLALHLADSGLFDKERYAAAARAARPEPEADATVLIYMIASDLESRNGRATADLTEMCKAELGDNINVVLQTGGTNRWRNSWMTAGETQRFRLTDGTFECLQTVEGAVMSRPDTLANFLRWGTEAYPAQRYILVFWNHGGGTAKGYGVDETAGGDSLMLDELSLALEWADVEFDLVGFDACLMATMSNACMLSRHADYLLASVDYEPKNGWQYTRWLDLLSGDPDVAVPALAEVIADDYMQESLDQNWKNVTISLIDLGGMKAVAEAWSSVSRQLADAVDAGKFKSIRASVLKTKEYGTSGEYDQRDMLGWLSYLESSSLASVSALRKAVENAVLFVKNTPDMKECGGLAVYLPLDTAEQYLGGSIRSAVASCGLGKDGLCFWDRFAAAQAG